MIDILKGDKMFKTEYAAHSIDKVLDFIEKDINDPAKEGVVENLVDIHAFLTHIKGKSIVKNGSKATLASDLLLYANMISDAFNVVFGEWAADVTIVDDRVIVCNDVIYCDINMDSDAIECIISFYRYANPVIVGEVCSTLKDIFGMGLKISGEVFIIDEANNSYIWGNEEIDNYLRRVNGIKIKPILWFDNNELGNC